MSGPSHRAPRFVGRRRVLGAAAAPLGWVAPVPATGAAPVRPPTPRQSLGPFYPDPPPADAGPDLVIERDGRRALGELVLLSGQAVDTTGRPLAGGVLELWQCNAAGRYHHPRDRSPAPIDPLFRGYGRAVADGEGRFGFRTIRPVPYPGRTPHLHLRVTSASGVTLVTQVYVRGEPANERDGLLAWLPPEARERLMADFVRGVDGVWRVRFDPVLAV
jgi:protocatechuate 3,4-dioxygenase beta subunit